MPSPVMRVPVSSAAGVTLDAATNPYLPFPSEILGIVRHTTKEYSFRMAFSGEVRPGQFFEVSIPKFGEAPISVSGIMPGKSVDLTIRRVGVVTNEVFELSLIHISELTRP